MVLRGQGKGKGVAVRYIIVIILGIAVVAVLGYWFFVLSREVGEESTTAECDTKRTSYCQAWKVTSWTVQPLQPDWGTCTPITLEECKTLLGE